MWFLCFVWNTFTKLYGRSCDGQKTAENKGSYFTAFSMLLGEKSYSKITVQELLILPM